MQRINRRPDCADIWQFKILSSILQRSSPTTTSSQVLLSHEIMRSHIDRIALRMASWSTQYRTLLQRFLCSSSCIFMYESDPSTLAHMSALITFYDMPINVMNCIDVVDAGSLNYLRLLNEGRKLRLATHTVQCMWRCLNGDSK